MRGSQIKRDIYTAMETTVKKLSDQELGCLVGDVLSEIDETTANLLSRAILTEVYVRLYREAEDGL
jgi:hypothetical protein